MNGLKEFMTETAQAITVSLTGFAKGVKGLFAGKTEVDNYHPPLRDDSEEVTVKLPLSDKIDDETLKTLSDDKNSDYHYVKQAKVKRITPNTGKDALIPNHYAARTQCDLLSLMIDDNLLYRPEVTAGIEFCVGNMIKYIVRFKNKNGLQDLGKARIYFHRVKDKYIAPCHNWDIITGRANALCDWYVKNFGRDKDVEQLLFDIMVWYYSGTFADSVDKGIEHVIAEN